MNVSGDELAKLMAAQVPKGTETTDVIAACTIIIAYGLRHMTPEQREAVMDAAGHFIWNTLEKQDEHDAAALRDEPPWGHA